MLSLLLSSPPSFYGFAIGAVLIAFALIRLGHRILELGHHVLELLRDYRDFRDGY